MPADSSLPSWAQRLIELRRSQAWSPADLARELKKRREGLPSVRSLAHMIQLDWETGKHHPGPRYRLLLAAVHETDERQIFGAQAIGRALPPPASTAAKPIAGAFEAQRNARPALDEAAPMAEETSFSTTDRDWHVPRRISGAVEALQITMTSDQAGLDLGRDGLAELVFHYAHAVAVTPSTAIYAELLSARSFAGTLLERASLRQRADLKVTAGWLSSLLAITAADLGDHAAAIVWCTDTERRGRDAGYPELLGWAALTRSLIAWYQGDTMRSAAVAQRGQADGLPGSVAHAKLAAHEMRCLAMLGDVGGMASARRRAATAMAQLGPSAPRTGVYSVPRADDPPYTATSLLLADRYAEAAQMTRRLIDTAYHPQSTAYGSQPTTYARTLLILAIAAVGLGDLDEAAAAGASALDSGPVVWSTVMLAGKLDRSLARRFPRAAHSADFHDRCVEAGAHLAVPTARPAQG
jgi:hypothetical protein